MEPIGSETKFNAFIIVKGDVIYSPGDISPDSTGSKKTSGFNRANNTVGAITMTP
jgi:hypothetical protein